MRKKLRVYSMFKKIQFGYLFKKYINWGVLRAAVCLSYIGRTVPKG
jgi:hypothetical protein